MTSAADALAEFTALVDPWLLKWGKVVEFDGTEPDQTLQKVWSLVSRFAHKLQYVIQNQSLLELIQSPAEVRLSESSQKRQENWNYERMSLGHPADSLALDPSRPKLGQASSPPSSLENLPAEILQMIFDKVIQEWEEDTFELLCLSRPLYRVVQTALYHTPPALTSWGDVHSLLRKFEKCPRTTAFVKHLRYAIPSAQTDLLQRLSIYKLFLKCTSLQILSVFSNLTAIFDNLDVCDGYALLKGKTTLAELQVLDDVEPQFIKLIQCMDGLKTINSFDGHSPCEDSEERLWSSQNTEHYDLARTDLVLSFGGLRDMSESHMDLPPDLALPSSLQDLRMLYDDYEAVTVRDSFVSRVLTNTIRQNRPLPTFRLLELFIPNESLDTFLYPILRACKGTLKILRLSLEEQPSWNAHSETHPLCLTKEFYDLVAQTSHLQVLELRYFPLADWEFPCTGPFTASLQELALTHCFGKGVQKKTLHKTWSRFLDTLQALHLVR
ncbi:hypothetical protein BT69DRAFT_1358938 [Atractiella rhizophila]|nr:hypothetical protein BT69DRAFT_1358938 [Atractiella rhizophila]